MEITEIWEKEKKRKEDGMVKAKKIGMIKFLVIEVDKFYVN